MEFAIILVKHNAKGWDHMDMIKKRDKYRHQKKHITEKFFYLDE